MSTLPVYKTAGHTTSSAPPGIRVTVFDRNQEVRIPASASTLSGFRAWAKSMDFPERGRISFIGGEIVVDMSPEEVGTHVAVKTEITYAIAHLNKRLKLGRFFADGALVTNVAAEVSNEPDATFLLWESLEAGRVRLVPREGAEGQYMEIEGAADWVVEIVSDSSVRKDTEQLREHYHRAGVREYWLIDARGEAIDFQILVWADSGYEPAATSRGGWQASPVFRRRFRLLRRKDRVGLWDYTLQVKPLSR
jgi:Uma2 family endonuclease